MALDMNNTPVAINDWVEYEDDFLRRYDCDAVQRGQVVRVTNSGEWLYVDFPKLGVTGPSLVYAKNVKRIS